MGGCIGALLRLSCHLTFDLSGVPKARPLEGRVRHEFTSGIHAEDGLQILQIEQPLDHYLQIP